MRESARPSAALGHEVAAARRQQSSVKQGGAPADARGVGLTEWAEHRRPRPGLAGGVLVRSASSSIGWRITLTVMATTACALAIACGGFAVHLIQSTRAALVSDLASLADV